jgi:hypothetical protein
MTQQKNGKSTLRFFYWKSKQIRYRRGGAGELVALMVHRWCLRVLLLVVVLRWRCCCCWRLAVWSGLWRPGWRQGKVVWRGVVVVLLLLLLLLWGGHHVDIAARSKRTRGIQRHGGPRG